jgi:SAM-dependent methyltransferase
MLAVTLWHCVGRRSNAISGLPAKSMGPLRCRSCDAQLATTFVDLGISPLANAFLRPDQIEAVESFYPLHAFVCDRCFLVQLEAVVTPEEIFNDYVYFSSFSDTWLDHCSRYVEMIIPRLRLSREARVVEIASNDGALLGFFRRRGFQVLGVEPAANVARAAIKNGVPTEIAFFGKNTAARIRGIFSADLIIANNVLAHVPDLNDFLAGLKLLLSPNGTITIEFPHVARLISGRQFDTIYHEHLSYFSLLAAEPALARHGLAVFDVETLPVHGGSLRLYVCHRDSGRQAEMGLATVRAAESAAGLDRIETYRDFASVPAVVRSELLEFLTRVRRAGKRVVGYAAAAKGNTLLNYCGIGSALIEYVVDRSPHKQGLLLPGSHLPVHAPARVFETKPDYLLILAWNLKEEVLNAMAKIHTWGGHFVVPIPRLEVV